MKKIWIIRFLGRLRSTINGTKSYLGSIRCEPLPNKFKKFIFNFKMSIWEHIHDYLSKGQRLMLLFVIQSQGSSPGRKGFCMIVDKSGEMVGSIGGGIMEQKLVELARTKLKGKAFQPFLKRQVHRKTGTSRSGMICSGEQTIAFYRLDTTHFPVVTKILNCLNKGKSGFLELNERGISFIDKGMPSTPVMGKQIWNVRQKFGFSDRIYILGGGHVGLALSTVMRQIGFYVEIFDNRKNLNTMVINQAAHKKHLVNYASLGDQIPEGINNYVAIVSFGYRTDKAVLRNLIGKKYAYLGMMGSKEKVRQLFSELKSEGIPASTLKEVRTPIGIPIQSKTPEEIAISIASEIIGVRNQLRANR
jgi:xanthine dehydrogenase accessory factor